MYDEDTLCGLTDEELDYRFRRGVEIEIEIKKLKGVPIAKYDVESGTAYLEYPDGRREYAKEA